MREPNEIDFWRGFALVTIFINHIPGIVYDRFTSRNYSVSDSAEMFVFLAGWSLRYVVRSKRRTRLEIQLRLLGRATRLYVAQLALTVGAIATTAAAALWFEQPLLLEWNNAEIAFVDPPQAYVGVALLTYQLGFFNILPLYVALMVFAPLAALIDSRSPWALFAFSAAIWISALVFGLNFPTWPVEGRWYFNPLAWQFIFTLGFLLARGDAGPGLLARRFLPVLRLAAIPVVAAGAVSAWIGYAPNPAEVPEPKLVFMFDKTYATPGRVIHFLCAAALFAGLWPRVYARAGRGFAAVSAFLSRLGRNSLLVFCLASLLSLFGQVARFAIADGVAMDSLIVLSGVAIMGFAAWISEWREKPKSA